MKRQSRKADPETWITFETRQRAKKKTSTTKTQKTKNKNKTKITRHIWISNFTIKSVSIKFDVYFIFTKHHCQC
jgi:3-phenylpropionate/cinnamic acid dioxygenase small subunit